MTRTSSLLRGALLAALAIGAAPSQAHGLEPMASHFLPLAGEPAPMLHVEPPLADPLAARATVIIPYRIENLRILPIFGPAGTAVSPRAGHLHVTVDDLPWHWADAGNTEAIVLAGLAPGPHKILIEIATPEHKVIEGKSVSFVVPDLSLGAHAGQ